MVNGREPHWWRVNHGSGNGLEPSPEAITWTMIDSSSMGFSAIYHVNLCWSRSLSPYRVTRPQPSMGFSAVTIYGVLWHSPSMGFYGTHHQWGSLALFINGVLWHSPSMGFSGTHHQWGSLALTINRGLWHSPDCLCRKCSIESTRTTSMEDVSTGVLEKIKNI